MAFNSFDIPVKDTQLFKLFQFNHIICKLILIFN